MASGGNDREQKVLKDLLKMSLKLTDQELKDYSQTEMDEERKEWLRQAIEHTLENDDGKKLMLFTDMFFAFKPEAEFEESELNNLESVFEQLQFLIEGMDMAKDFNKLGGLLHCLHFLKNKHISLQWRAADLIANCAQNNPKCQETLIEHNAMELLFYTLKKSIEDIVRVKCVYALSKLIGDYDPAEALFVRLKGVDCLLGLLQEQNDKLSLKSAFLLRKIVHKDIIQLEYMKLCESLLELLKKEHHDTHEIFASMILYMMSNDANVLKKCKDQSQCLKKLFDKRVNYLQETDADKYEEEIISYKSILKFL